MTAITVDACAGYAYTAGFRGESLVTIVAIAGPESGYDPTKHNPNAGTGDDSYGLWQINMLGTLGPARRKTYALSSNDKLYDPATNARVAWGISGGGVKFTDWTTFNKGLHRKYLDAARAAAQAVEARSGGAVAAGALPLEANGGTSTGVLAGEVLPPGGNLGFGIANVSTIFPAFTTTGGTLDSMLRLARTGIQGSVSLSVSSVAEVTATFPDPLGPVQAWRYFPLRSNSALGDLPLVVAGNDWADSDGVLAFTVTFRPTVVDNLRSNDPKSASKMWSNLSPTEVLQERVLAAGGRFYGKATARRTQITRLGIDDSSKQVAENDWDMGQRLAKEEGFWLFETAGAVYFAPPTWLADHGTIFEARYRPSSAERLWECIGIPDAHSSLDDYPYGARAIARSITLPMPRWRGEQMRPGMSCNFRGYPGWDVKLDNTGPPQWVVTDVTWALDGGATPASVTITEAIDPIPQPASDDSTGADDSTGPTGTPAAAASTGVNFPSGTGVSNQGKGSYGYQYDPVGNTPATGPQPGATILMAHLVRTFHCTNAGIFNNRDVNGTSTPSVHSEGRAGDSGMPVSSISGNVLADYLVANAPALGIQYLIWNARSWNASRRSEGWRTYKAPNGKTDNTSLHRDHVHWELCWEAAKYLTAAACAGAKNNLPSTD